MGRDQFCEREEREAQVRETEASKGTSEELRLLLSSGITV